MSAFGVAGLVSASNGLSNSDTASKTFKVNVSEAQVKIIGEMLCQHPTYNDCQGNQINDTLCWEEGNTQSFINMMECHETASDAWQEYGC